MYIVYVLYSPSYQKIYIGFSSDLDKRLLSHNQLSKKGYTIKYRPWEVAYLEKFESKKAAMRREKELKSAQGRAFVWQIIKDNYQL
jgi:putative endonuclease